MHEKALLPASIWRDGINADYHNVLTVMSVC